MTPPLILSIDQGTTSTRALAVDPARGEILAQEQLALHQHYPADGWVEHDAEEIWQAVLHCCRAVLARLGVGRFAGIGITNQRETTVLWERANGRALRRAIVWQDRRTADRCAELAAAGHGAQITARTGLLLDPYFTGTKLAWLLDHVEGARARAAAGELAAGTIDSWLIWRLTGGAAHVTDITNASRTLLCNIHTGDWDADLLGWLNVPKAVLPRICASTADFGRCDPAHFGAALPVLGVAGDQQAALVGQACFQPGMIKSTYGTGCFMLLNTGTAAPVSRARLLATVAYEIESVRAYALEGSIFMAGAVIDWLKTAGLIGEAAEAASLAAVAKAESGCYLVPGFVGLGAPYWAPDARGAFVGMTRDTGRAELAAAALDSVCYQSRDLIEAMRKDSATPVVELRVDGGMTVSDYFLQRLADLTGVAVVRAANAETTAMGAAYLAALQAGLIGGTEDISNLWADDGRFEPRLSPAARDALYAGWGRAVARVL